MPRMTDHSHFDFRHESSQPEAQIFVPWSTSPEDRQLAYYARGTGTSFDLWVVSLEHSASGLVAGRPEVFLATPKFETYPAISPDGRTLAYVSYEYGRQEIYVRGFPEGRQATSVVAYGGAPPVWSRESPVLYFLGEDRHVMAVDYETQEGRFLVSEPRCLPQGRYVLS